MKNHVKPIIQKVAIGEKLTITEYNKVASDKKAEDLIKEEKSNTVDAYVEDKKAKINQEKLLAENKKNKEDTKEEEKQDEKKEEREGQ